jgi:hypothetical protein
MATNILQNIFNFGTVQSGLGVPNHVEPIGTLFIDRQSGIGYFNKDGNTNWSFLLDSSASLSSSTSGVTYLYVGTGLSATSNSGIVILTNTAPDQIVNFTSDSNISVSGTYPNFTLSFPNPYVTAITLTDNVLTVNLNIQCRYNNF